MTIETPRPSAQAGEPTEGGSRRWRLQFRRHAPEAAPVAPIEEEDETPFVEFVAYAEDCVLSGFVGLETDRLSDLLNENDEVLLVDVQADDLATGERREIAEISVGRDELMLVHASGPRGAVGRRIRTRQHLVAMGSGPFSVRGYLHCPPGTDPLASFRRRKPMVPLTEACVEYSINGTTFSRVVPSLIVNRHLVDWIEAVVEKAAELPALPEPVLTGSRAKDMTGHVRSGPDPEPEPE